MSDYGSKAALFTYIRTVISKKKPPDKITPAQHLQVLEALYDTLVGAAGASKDTWSGNLTAGYTDIPHGKGINDFTYYAIRWNGTEYVPLNLLVTKITTTYMRIYVGSSYTGVRITFV